MSEARFADEARVLERLVAWGDANESIRALVLTSSRARRDASVDALSDYDVIVAVRDPEAFAVGDWAGAYARPVASWGDQGETLGSTTIFRGVVYEDGAKVDYTIWPAELVERVADADVLPDDLDVGYRVLVDKDEATSRWGPPTQRAHVPERPTEDEYRSVVEEFWWVTTYVAKSLWRREMFFTKFVLDHDAKHGALRRVLEWRIEVDHDWSVRPGAYGRGLERLLPPDVQDELASTYVGFDIDENWGALFKTTALFRRVATEVGTALGYAYPQEVDETISAHLRAVHRLARR